MASINPSGSLELNSYETKVFDLLLRVVEEKSPSTVLRAAGGWVRDKLLKRESHDIDIAVDNMSGIAFAELVQACLESAGESTHSIGRIKANPEQSKHLETATMMIYGDWVDFVNLRSEEYGESRIAVMKPGTPQEDAERRDLTINSLFYNINTRKVEDFTGMGLDDLDQGIIRTPLPPMKTFLDDPLRVLRAYRFASRYGYAMVPEMVEAISSHAVHDALETKVSRERFGLELVGMLRGPSPLLALSYMTQYRTSEVVFELPPGFAPAVPSQAQDAFPRLGLGCAAAFYTMAESSAARGLVSLAGAGEDDIHEAGEDASTFVRTYGYLAAYLLPLAGASTGKKARKISVANYILVSSVKRPTKSGRWVEAVHNTALALAPLFEDGALAPSRVELGNMLRTGAGQHWDVALTLAAVLAMGPDSGPEVHASESDVVQPWSEDAFPAVYARHAELHALVGELFPDTAPWDMSSALNGKEIMTALGLTRGGKVIGQVVDALIQAQLAEPGRDKAYWTAWVSQRYGSGAAAADEDAAGAGGSGGAGGTV